MKPRAATDVHLAHPWFVEEGVFAAATEQTQYLDVLDLLPAGADAARAAVTYARDGREVSLQGASLVFEPHEDDLTDSGTGASVAAVARAVRSEGLRKLAWQADAELRKIPTVVRGVVGDLRAAVRSGRVPASVVPGAFVAGVVMTLLASWVL